MRAVNFAAVAKELASASVEKQWISDLRDRFERRLQAALSPLVGVYANAAARIGNAINEVGREEFQHLGDVPRFRIILTSHHQTFVSVRVEIDLENPWNGDITIIVEDSTPPIVLEGFLAPDLQASPYQSDPPPEGPPAAQS